MYNIFFQKVTDFLVIKDTTKAALERLGIKYLRDLLFYRPTSYNINDTSPNLSYVQDKQLIQTKVTIDEINVPRTRGRPTKIYVSNDTGSMILVFFNKIPAFIFAKLKIGSSHIVAGKVQYFDGMIQITHPEFIFKKELSVSVEPVYPLTYGLINKQLYGYIIEAIKAITIAIKARTNFGNPTVINTNGENPDSDNNPLLNEQQYMESLLKEIKQLHLIGISPQEMTETKLNSITEKLATKELFANQLSLLKLKEAEHSTIGRKFVINKKLQQEILANLGFELTKDQVKVITEIEQEQEKQQQMMRLLQGDVGSGKTLVAMLTIINVVQSQQQVAFMAPTDLLSLQHYQFFQKALKNLDINVALLTGKTKAKERRYIKADLADGNIDILIGTHALFQEGVDFKDLGFVVIDEQHRFGVEQRLELINKASHPDVLVMTATPIPRSLTLTIFGDMESSQIKTKPKDRLPIITTVTSLGKKEAVINSLAKKLDQGEKIYWVCPLIDPKDTSLDGEDEQNIEDNRYADVTTRFQELAEHYPEQVGLLHGRIKNAEKEQLMQDFKAGKLRILVTTTVIEVGIDVPDSTLMIIENAEKFGLAQLHQLRGRVGRGNLQSYCMLLYNPKRFSKLARKRLEIMRNSTDGFYIAEQDLILRGGGEILGTKQSGEPNFFFADLTRDIKILLAANKLASSVIHDQFTKFQSELFAKDRTELIKSG